MLNFHDSAAAIEEPKTARMEQRTKPHVKQQIQWAAALLGVDETTFVTTWRRSAPGSRLPSMSARSSPPGTVT